MSIPNDSPFGNDNRPPIPAPAPVPATVVAEVLSILDRYEDAHRRQRAAPTLADREAAEAERRACEGAYLALEQALAELHLRMLRATVDHQRAALADLLADVLAGPMMAIARAVLEEMD